MNILIFCNPNNIHNYNYIKNVLCKENYELTVYSYSLPLHGINSDYLEFYRKNNVHIIGGHSISEVGHIRYIFKSYLSIKQLNNNFDCLHVQYVSPYIAPIICLFRKKFKKIILTYWGSDLLRSNVLFRLLCRPLVSVSSWITFITSEMQLTFEGYYHVKPNQQLGILDFGNMFFNQIDEKQHLIQGGLRNTLYEQFHLDPQKITITVGYYWRKQMRQLETVSCLVKSGVLNPERVQFAIPAYSIPEREKTELESLCSSRNFNVVVFDYFMNEEQVSGFRAISDVFINAQTTDAFSSAMTEHLYAGSVVINGSWLEYSVLDEHDIYYKQFDSFNELPSIVNECITNLSTEKQFAKNNSTKIASFCSWDCWRQKWLDLYV